MTDWREDAKFVHAELARLNRNIERWEEKSDELYATLDKRTTALETHKEVAAGKAGVVAVFASAIVSAGAWLLNFLLTTKH